MTTTIYMPNFFDRYYLEELKKETFSENLFEFRIVDSTAKQIEIEIVHSEWWTCYRNENVQNEVMESQTKRNESYVMEKIFSIYETYQNEILSTLETIEQL